MRRAPFPLLCWRNTSSTALPPHSSLPLAGWFSSSWQPTDIRVSGVRDAANGFSGSGGITIPSLENASTAHCPSTHCQTKRRIPEQIALLIAGLHLTLMNCAQVVRAASVASISTCFQVTRSGSVGRGRDRNKHSLYCIPTPPHPIRVPMTFGGGGSPASSRRRNHSAVARRNVLPPSPSA